MKINIKAWAFRISCSFCMVLAIKVIFGFALTDWRWWAIIIPATVVLGSGDYALEKGGYI